MKRRLLLACLCVLGPMASTDGAEAPALLMLGEARILVPRAGTNQLRYVRPFELAVRGSNWWITTYQSPDKMSDTDFHWQVFNISDGLIAQCYSPKGDRLLANLRPMVAPVQCPDQVSQFIWLMFTASVRADGSNGVVLPPVYNPSADLGTNPNLRRKCEVEYLDAHRLWLKHIRFLNDGTFNSFSSGVNHTNRHRPPYDEGFLEARFETVAVTNWNGVKVPLRVNGEESSPGGGRSPADLRTNQLIEITVTEIQSLPSEVKLPPPPDASTSITDARAPIAPGQMIGFTVEDGKWPTLQQSQAVTEKAKREREERKSPPR